MQAVGKSAADRIGCPLKQAASLHHFLVAEQRWIENHKAAVQRSNAVSGNRALSQNIDFYCFNIAGKLKYISFHSDLDRVQV